MRTLAVVLAGLACACATKPIVEVSPVALVVEYVKEVRPLDRRTQVYHLIAGQLHATKIVAQLSDLNEDDFAAVVVLKRDGGTTDDRAYDYDVTNKDRSRRTTWTLPYDVRRDGQVTRTGTLTIVYEGTDLMDPTPRIENIAVLLRNLGAG